MSNGPFDAPPRTSHRINENNDFRGDLTARQYIQTELDFHDLILLRLSLSEGGKRLMERQSSPEGQPFNPDATANFDEEVKMHSAIMSGAYAQLCDT